MLAIIELFIESFLLHGVSFLQGFVKALPDRACRLRLDLSLLRNVPCVLIVLGGHVHLHSFLGGVQFRGGASL